MTFDRYLVYPQNLHVLFVPKLKVIDLSDPKGVVEMDKEQKLQMKYEIAEELGYLEKVRESGWKSLTAKETGRIGGILSKRSRQKKSS